MGWTDPHTWVDGEVVDADIYNTHVRDNLNALKNPPSDSYVLDEVSDYATTSAAFVDIDATNLSLTITTTGGDVVVGFVGAIKHTTAGALLYLDLELDGTRIGGDDGILVAQCPVNGYAVNMSFQYLITSLAAGTHTISLQWKTSAATATLPAGAGTANYDVHPLFWIKEW